LVDFLATLVFFKEKWKKKENVVICERAYAILEIMSIKGYEMWTNVLNVSRKNLQPTIIECKNNRI
jgi:hypothetical protein